MNKKLIIALIITSSLIIATIFFVVGFITYYNVFDSEEQEEEITKDDKNCNTAIVKIKGDIVSYIEADGYNNEGHKIVDEISIEEVVDVIDDISESSNIRYVLFDVDSGGGDAVAGKEINDYIKAILKDKKTVSYIKYGASAAYYIASATNYIIANKLSDVGSIGVTSSFLDDSEKLKKDGYKFISISSGKFKDTFHNGKETTDEEIKKGLEVVMHYKEIFVKDVAENRRISIDEVNKIADGSTFVSDKALEYKLIDQVGGWYDVKQYLENKLGEKPVFCNF